MTTTLLQDLPFTVKIIIEEARPDQYYTRRYLKLY